MVTLYSTQMVFPNEPFSEQEIDDKFNFKTEICRNWSIGTCQWGEKCIFAHGYSDLHDKKSLKQSYKTKKCKLFHETGYCIYGNRCQFSHKEIIEIPEPVTRKRLTIFINIEKKGSNFN